MLNGFATAQETVWCSKKTKHEYGVFYETVYIECITIVSGEDNNYLDYVSAVSGTGDLKYWTEEYSCGKENDKTLCYENFSVKFGELELPFSYPIVTFHYPRDVVQRDRNFRICGRANFEELEYSGIGKFVIELKNGELEVYDRDEYQKLSKELFDEVSVISFHFDPIILENKSRIKFPTLKIKLY